MFHRLNGDEYGWDTKQLMKERKLKLCDSNISLKKELGKSSLCIISYNSTAALETLAANFPTILYWPTKIFEIRKEADLYMNYLCEAGIYHTSAESASDHLNNIINDIDGWWNKSLVQKTRKMFIKKYAFSDKKWIKYWRNELISQSDLIK